MLHPNILVPVVTWEERRDRLPVSGIRIQVENISLF